MRSLSSDNLSHRAVIVVCLWIILWLLGGEITETTVLATLAAIFGPGIFADFRNG